MNSTIEIENILSKVEKLDDKDKITLINKIRSFLIPKQQSKSIADLKGLGKEIWKDVDIDDYVSKEREW